MNHSSLFTNGASYWSVIRLRFFALLLAIPAVSAAGTSTDHLSVIELPEVNGHDQSRVAVSWNGVLPVRLEVGVEQAGEGFVAIADPVELTESMTLMPHPAPGQKTIPFLAGIGQ